MKRKRNSIFAVHEGDREQYFLEYIAGFSDVRMNLEPCYGGNATHILNTALKHADCGIKTIVLFDEDFEWLQGQGINDEALAGLEMHWKLDNNTLCTCHYRDLQGYNDHNRNPILIVSYPQSIEGLLLLLMGRTERDLNGKTTAMLKSIIAPMVEHTKLIAEDMENIKQYENKIDEYAKAINQLSPGCDNYRERVQLYKSKQEGLKKKINAIVFKRFLSNEISLEKLRSKRNDINPIDKLLTAFEL